VTHRFLLLSILVALFFSTFLTLSAETSEPLIPKSFIYFYLNDISSPSKVFLVDKHIQKAYFISFKQSPLTVDIIAEFEVATGKQKGAKQYEGDLRTPNGVYEILQFRPKQTLQSKFGSGAFILNYPNSLDRFQLKTGSGIWIHGHDLDSFIDYDSEGCIRLHNDDILSLIDHLKPKQAPVIIEEVVEWVKPKDLLTYYQSISQRIDEWSTAWKERQIDTYLSFYHNSFWNLSTKQDIIGWKESQTALFDSIEEPILELNSAKYLIDDKLILLEVEYQLLMNDDLLNGSKKVLWQLIDDRFYIVQEE
jgi:murein L,D-transpeptidase YafK